MRTFLPCAIKHDNAFVKLFSLERFSSDVHVELLIFDCFEGTSDNQMMNFILYWQFPLRECFKNIFHGCY